MTPAYMPFTYLSESTARMLSALVGPVVIYQPSKKHIPIALSALASQGLVEIRTPITREDDRLQAALAEFMEWARKNPAPSTPGLGFISARQGEIPFFDDTVINRIRFDIKQYQATDGQSDHQADENETSFSARLFLALAQENDLATTSLDHNLQRFKVLEKEFLETLTDADEAAFDRQALSGTIWREDPGEKLTGQRIRAWATLAAADAGLPQLLLTTSPAVIDTLQEFGGEAIGLEKLVDLGLSASTDTTVPVLSNVLADLAVKAASPSVDHLPAEVLPADATVSPTVKATLYLAANRTPTSVIRRMANTDPALPGEDQQPQTAHHTLIILVKG